MEIRVTHSRFARRRPRAGGAFCHRAFARSIRVPGIGCRCRRVGECDREGRRQHDGKKQHCDQFRSSAYLMYLLAVKILPDSVALLYYINQRLSSTFWNFYE